MGLAEWPFTSDDFGPSVLARASTSPVDHFGQQIDDTFDRNGDRRHSASPTTFRHEEMLYRSPSEELERLQRDFDESRILNPLYNPGGIRPLPSPYALRRSRSSRTASPGGSWRATPSPPERPRSPEMDRTSRSTERQRLSPGINF
jgi:hypothetical protein